MDLVLNNQQWLICHKTKPNQISAFHRMLVTFGKGLCISNFLFSLYAVNKLFLMNVNTAYFSAAQNLLPDKRFELTSTSYTVYTYQRYNQLASCSRIKSGHVILNLYSIYFCLYIHIYIYIYIVIDRQTVSLYHNS